VRGRFRRRDPRRRGPPPERDRHRPGRGALSLADVTFALAANTRGKAIAANCSINFCNAARAGTLRARATEVSLSRKLGTYQVTVEDSGGKTVALFHGLAYRKD